MTPKTILFYDGDCGVCNKAVQFILKNETNHAIYFAALQSSFAIESLRKYGVSELQMDTMYYVVNNQLFERSTAWIMILKQMSQPWRFVATILGLIPAPLRNSGYNWFAKKRHLFSQADHCLIPHSNTKLRFLH